MIDHPEFRLYPAYSAKYTLLRVYMRDVALHFSAFIGGLFSGYLAAVLAFFVWGLIREGVSNPKKMAIPSIFLLSIFGSALLYVTGIVFENWPLFLGTAITFTHGARKLFGPEDPIE